MEFVLVQKKGAFKQVTDVAHRAPGKIPQTSPNKEKNPSEAVGETSGASSRERWVRSWKPIFFDTPSSLDIQGHRNWEGVTGSMEFPGSLNRW